jgi:hypothetical protein
METTAAVPGRGGTQAGVVPYLSHWGAAADQRCWSLDRPVLTIGRSPVADLVVDDPLVSRVHTRLELVAGTWTVVDDGLSRNGTYVNGRRLVGRVALHDRDVLRIGSSLLTFCAPAEEAGPRTVVGEVLVDPGALTLAQRAVLVALCRPLQQGQHYATPATNLEIARELFLSVDGVKAHLRALYHRLGIDDLAQNQKRLRLAEMALRHGLVSTHEL